MTGIALKDRVTNAVLWLGVTKVLGQAISWVITVYVARLLSPDDYGLMGMSVIFTGFILLFNELGLGAAIVQKKDLTEEELSSIFWVLLPLNFFLFVFSCLAAPYVASFFNEPRLASIIRVTSVTFVITGFGAIPSYMLTKQINFNKKSKAELIANFVGGISMFLLAFYGFGVWSLVLGYVALAITKNILFIVYYPFRPRLYLSITKVKGMLNFGGKVLGGSLLWYIYSEADYLIGGKVLGKTLLGFYFLAFQFASLPLEKIVSLVSQVAFPAFSEIQDDKARLRSAFLKIIRIIAFVTFPMFMGIFLVADEAVNLFLTAKWAPIILPLRILCIVSTMRALNSINSPLAAAIGRPGIVMISNLSFAIFLPIGLYVGSFYGLVGFSYAWLFVFPLIFLAYTHITIKTIGLTLIEYFNEIKDVIIATVFMVICVSFLKAYIFIRFPLSPRLALLTISGAVSYLAYFALFKRSIISEALAIVRRKTL